MTPLGRKTKIILLPSTTRRGGDLSPRGVAWQRLGTGLTVRPAVPPRGQIRLTLTPWLSYVTAGGGGSVELAAAARKLVVAAGAKM